ncbi:hypothetical protein BT96DRAFT_1021331 [Gymnopus androsaceus JB14]|uniref:Uncharacterized protein n=1 Tax=Gymnopus androsaceus JB14 TaxID=1447944 RepID=A0A6A4HFX0_9AGAR|nr:hypothetical protein BT96DRAFT_1021331 [Gymnopus androsaceus JB14]
MAPKHYQDRRHVYSWRWHEYLKSELSSTFTSRSASPTIAISPPTPGEELELDLPAAIRAFLSNDLLQMRANTLIWDGHDFTYFSLSEEKAASELEHLAAPKVLCNGTMHPVSFQPHPEKHSQYRYVTMEWNLEDSGFRAVFEGHAAGDETVLSQLYLCYPVSSRSTPSLVISNIENDQASASALSSSAPALNPSLALTLKTICPAFPVPCSSLPVFLASHTHPNFPMHPTKLNP